MTLRRAVPGVLLGCVVLAGCVALSGCQTQTASEPPPPPSGPPVITVLPGAGDAALAQTAAPGQFFASGGPVTVGALRLTVVYPELYPQQGAEPTLSATDAKSGRKVWAYKDPIEPELWKFAVGGGVVAIEVGHQVGKRVSYTSEQLDVVDLATGTPLWRSTMPGDGGSVLVAMPGLVVFDSTGRAVAVHARTGVLAWTAGAPPQCPPITPGDGGLADLAADADVMAATFTCQSADVTVSSGVAERLDLRTGAAIWTTPKYPPGDPQLLAVPVNTDVVVIPEMGNGTYLEGPIRQWIPPGVPDDDIGGAVYTVLDVSTGAVRWTEAGAPIYNAGAYGDNAGSLCFIGAHTYECRSPKDGTLVRVGGPASP